MKRSEAVAPFLRADPQSVDAAAWKVAGTGELLEPRLPHWDPDLKLRLDRDVAVDLDLLLASTRTGAADELALTCVWKSDRTRLRGTGMTVPLSGRDGRVTVSLSVDVDGHAAGGGLELETLLVRATDVNAPSPVSASRAGSILWSDRVSVALEGDAARFPVTVLDFDGVPGLDPGAPWALEWDPQDLDQPVLGAMRLLVNSRDPVAVEAVGDTPGEEGRLIASVIRFDVARSLVHGALGNEEFVAGRGGFEPDSVGRMLADLLERYWPGSEPELLRSRLSTVSHRFESELQAAAGLLRR